MVNLNLEVITKNLLKLLDYSGITDISFSRLLDISEKQLRLIKTSEAEFNIANINRACDFFAISLSTINSDVIEVENTFREKLTLKHKNNLQYYSLLELRPSITHAIRFTLLEDASFKNKGLNVGEIRDVFLNKGWTFTSRYISTSMGRSVDLVEIRGKKLQKGKEVNIYTSKK